METKKPTREELEWRQREQRIWELQQKILQQHRQSMSMDKARWLAMKTLCLA